MLDGIIVLILIISAGLGYKKGMTKTLLGLVHSLIAIVIAFFIYPIVNNILKITPIYDACLKWGEKHLGTFTFGSGLQTQAEAIINALNWLPQIVSEKMVQNNNTEVYKMLGATNIKEYVIIGIANIFIGLIAIVFTWILIKVILTFGIKSLDMVVEHVPIISTLNRLGGGAIGLLKGILLIWIIFLVLPLLAMKIDITTFEHMIHSSMIGNWLYQNNFLLSIFEHTRMS